MAKPVALIGEKEIKRMLNGLPDKLSKRVIIQGEKRAARPLVRAAKRNAPVSSRSQMTWWGRRRRKYPEVKISPGTLKKSIGTLPIKSRNEFPGIMIGPRTGKRFKHDGWFGIFPEYGTKGYIIRKGRFKGRRMRGQSADPYMAPAFRENSQAMIKILAHSIGVEATKFLKKHAK